MKKKIIIKVEGTTNSGTTTIAHVIKHVLEIFGLESTIQDRDGVELTTLDVARNMEVISKDNNTDISIETAALSRNA